MIRKVGRPGPIVLTNWASHYGRKFPAGPAWPASSAPDTRRPRPPQSAPRPLSLPSAQLPITWAPHMRAQLQAAAHPKPPLLSALPPPPSPPPPDRSAVALIVTGNSAILAELAHRDPSVGAAPARAKNSSGDLWGNLPVSPCTASVFGLVLYAAPRQFFIYYPIQSGLAILEFANSDADWGPEGAAA